MQYEVIAIFAIFFIASLRHDISEASLAKYFREKFAERYFYNWKNFDKRFQSYKNIYPKSESGHTERANPGYGGAI